MNRKILLNLLVVALAVAMVTPAVMAATPGGASVVGSVTDKGEYPGSTANSVNIESGNIYLVNLTAEQSTYHWAGIYGNATGKLVLGDSSTAKMYEWDAVATYVFFDDDNTVDWSNISTATCTDVEGSYGFLTGASDDCSHTLTTTHDPTFHSIADIAATAAGQSYDDTAAAYWWTLAVKDGTNGDVLFVGEVDNSGHAGYDGTVVNYQTMLPEDGSNGDTTATPFYVWIELY